MANVLFSVKILYQYPFYQNFDFIKFGLPKLSEVPYFNIL